MGGVKGINVRNTFIEFEAAEEPSHQSNSAHFCTVTLIYIDQH